MKRKSVPSYAFQGEIIKPGIHADDLLEIMPRILFVRDPKVLGRDDDGLVVEWYYPDAVFTLARASGFNPIAGIAVTGYYVQKIEMFEQESTYGAISDVYTKDNAGYTEHNRHDAGREGD